MTSTPPASASASGPGAGRDAHLETLAVHAGRAVDPSTGAVTPPIHPSTTFERATDGSYPQGHLYTRYGNPTRNALEACLAQLDGGVAAAAFASGQAATASVFQALRAGDHVVLPHDAYFGTGKLVREFMAPWGLAATFVDMSDPGAVERALRAETRLVWVETPSNPLLKVTDIRAVAELAHQRGARVVCDNTVATPVLTRPLALGADLVMHSTTKYLSGHSDVLGGAVIAAADDDFFQRVRLVQGTLGAVPSPFDCWLTLRGISTLPLRVRQQSASALAVARFLAAHPAVEAVHYPGLPGHPGHDVAARQMHAFGGLLSVQVAGDEAHAMAVVARCRLFTRATSLGGVESLIEHRASNEAPGSTTPRNLLRVSVGLEHEEDLIADLRQALDT